MLYVHVELSCLSNDVSLNESSQQKEVELRTVFGRPLFLPPFRGIMKFHPFRMEVAKRAKSCQNHLEFAWNFRLESMPIDVRFS